MGTPANPPGPEPLERVFVASADSLTGVPLPLAPPRPAPLAPPRHAWLRLTLFCALLGSVLTVVYAWLLARQDAGSPLDASGLASYHQVLVPLLAIAALGGALILERRPVAGMALLLLGTGLGLPGGAAWLLPAAVLGCVWAAQHDAPARIVLGFLLLLPGIASVYYGALAGLSYLSGVPVHILPPGLLAPADLLQALAPLQLLPVALLGAWLLVTRRPSAA